MAELDESVQCLCKGLITFTEKEFGDRFRTFLESYDELKQKHRKSEVQNRCLKDIVAVSRDERGKELRSMLYGKLDSYLVTLNSKEKTYHSLFAVIQSLEAEVNRQVGKQYQERVAQLQRENDGLKANFAAFRHILNHNAKMSMEESRDSLFSAFKREVEGILNKEVLDKQQKPEQHERQGQQGQPDKPEKQSY